MPIAFLLATLAGTGLLMLPVARAGEGAAPFPTALFAATSAVCVTGLIVVDTPTYWSGFGQGVILALIQVGGFGIMTSATLHGLLVARRLRLATLLVAQAETRSLALGDVVSVLRLVLLVTVGAELVIAAALMLRLRYAYDEAWQAAIWNGLFHAVSAFNNADFSTYSDNLMGGNDGRRGDGALDGHPRRYRRDGAGDAERASAASLAAGEWWRSRLMAAARPGRGGIGRGCSTCGAPAGRAARPDAPFWSAACWPVRPACRSAAPSR